MSRNQRLCLFSLVLALSFGLSSCDLFMKSSKLEGDVLARVGENYLYTADLEEVIPLGTDSLDSISLAQQHINKWVENQLLLQKAELNLKEDQTEFEKKIEDYRSSLIIYAYEQELVRQKLDTNVSDQEIKAYYEDNPDNFQLKRYVVKAKLIKVDKQAPKLKKVRKWLVDEQPEDHAQLEEYCLQFSSLCLLDDQWMFFDELIRMAPIETIDVETYLRNNKFVEIESEQFFYFLLFIDYRLKNDLSPLELESDRIRKVIINKRKLSLLEKMRKDLHEEAMNSNQVEYFVK